MIGKFMFTQKNGVFGLIDNNSPIRYLSPKATIIRLKSRPGIL